MEEQYFSIEKAVELLGFSREKILTMVREKTLTGIVVDCKLVIANNEKFRSLQLPKLDEKNIVQPPLKPTTMGSINDPRDRKAFIEWLEQQP